MMRTLTVGQLAQETDVTKVAIRYYERCGLIPKAQRLKSGYRSYPETVIARICFVKNAQSVGFSLDEITELLTLQEPHKGTSQDINSRTLTKLKTIQDKIDALQEMANTLKVLTSACDGKMPLHECPILEALYSKNAPLKVFSTSENKGSPCEHHS